MKNKLVTSITLTGMLALLALTSTVSAFPVVKPTGKMLCTIKNYKQVDNHTWYWVPAKWIILKGKKVYVPGHCARGVGIPK